MRLQSLPILLHMVYRWLQSIPALVKVHWPLKELCHMSNSENNLSLVT